MLTHAFTFISFSIKRENVHMLGGIGDRSSLERECRVYEEKIQEYGGIDLMFMGTGPDGSVNLQHFLMLYLKYPPSALLDVMSRDPP